MDDFASEPQCFSLGLLPPRTPERADAQVPCDAQLGPVRYGRCSHVYFRSTSEPADVAFGFLDIEVSIQLCRDGKVEFELYCMGDGFQSARGAGQANPLRFEVWSSDHRLASIDWHYPLLVCGRTDPLAFSATIALAAEAFSRADRIFIPSANADVQD